MCNHIFISILLSLIFSLNIYGSKCSNSIAYLIERKDNQLDQFVAKYIKSLSHHKADLFSQFYLESCAKLCSLQLSTKTEVTFTVEVDTALTETELIFSKKQKILRLPSLESINEEEFSRVMKRWLVGHELHPYMKYESNIRFKKAQAIALRAFHQAFELGKRSFLHIAPTSMGKSAVIAKSILIRSKRRGAKKMSLLTVDKILLVDQIETIVRTENPSIKFFNFNDIPNDKFADV